MDDEEERDQARVPQECAAICGRMASISQALIRTIKMMPKMREALAELRAIEYSQKVVQGANKESIG